MFAGGIGDVPSIAIDVQYVDQSTRAFVSVNQPPNIQLSVPRYGVVATAVGKYVIFAGGKGKDNKYSGLIEVFSVDLDTGLLTRVKHKGLNRLGLFLSKPRSGIYPEVVGDHVKFVCDSDDVVDEFKVDPNTGKLTRVK
jgi:hypothetical protein